MDHLSEEQNLVLNCCLGFLYNGQEKGLVVNGVAGAGKSFLLKNLADVLDNNGWSVVASSFTNRVVNSLHRSICSCSDRAVDVFCTTIHKLFFNPIIDEEGILQGFEARDKEQVQQYVRSICTSISDKSVLLVDESSMVNSELLEQMIDNFPGPIIFFGDSNQLPPIGEEQSLMADWDINLSEINRAAEGSGIIQLSSDVRKKGHYNKSDFGKYNDVSFVKKGKITKNYLAEHYFDMILCGTHKQRRRFNHLTRVARGFHHWTYPVEGEYVTPVDTNSFVARGMIYRVEDSYLANTQDVILKLEDFQERFTVPLEYFITESKNDISMKDYKQGRFTLFTFAYAMTVHSAQGSEFDNLLVVNEDVSYFLNQKRFLYTAVTRAKESLTLAE